MWISFALLTPVILAALIPLAGLASGPAQGRIRRIVAIGAPLATVPAVAMTLWGAGTQLSLDWILTGITLAVDEVARGLTLIGALLYGAALMAVSWTKIRDSESPSGALSAFLLASYTGNIGVYLAADAVSFYLFFAIMSFSAAGLVVHYRTASAYRATRIYLVMTVISETALLAGLIFTVQAGGKLLTDAPTAILDSSRTGLILTLLLVGFGIKVGTVPLHVWLPLAHPAAPPAASAVLSGAMVKAGMVGFLRFFPLQAADAELNPIIEIFGLVLLILALVGAFAAVGVGAIQRDAKVILAYSTISQMGFIGAIIAAGLLDGQLAEDTIDAAVLYAVHHGLAKGALFLGVPVIKHYGKGAAGVVVTIGMVGATTLSGGNAVHYRCVEEEGWIPDLEHIESRVSERTKAIVIINPNNPTGAVYSRETLEGIFEIARRYDLVVLADEIYEKILYEDAEHIHAASIADDVLILTFSGLSKAYRVAGYRAGWVAVSGAKHRATDFLEGLTLLANMRMCSNVPAQHVIQTALGGYQSINDLILPGGRLLEQRNLATQMLRDIPGVSVQEARGALYLFPKLDPEVYPIDDDESFVIELLRQQQILVSHGRAFNYPDTDHFRLVTLPSVHELTEGIERIGAFLADYRNRYA